MQEQERTKVQLSVVQIIAGALASVSAAVVASTFGLKGTLLGAAVTSIVASVGSALYTHSLRRARARIQTRLNPHTGTIERVVIHPQRARRPIRWGRVAGATALVFVLAMGTITVIEVVARRPVTALVESTSPQQGGTTVGTLLQNAPGAAPLALPTIPMSSIPATAATGAPHSTPATSPVPGGTVTATPNGTTATSATPSGTPSGTPTARTTPSEPSTGTPGSTPSPGTPSPATSNPATPSTATAVRSITATPAPAAHTPTVPAKAPTATQRTGATPTPAKTSPATPTDPESSPQAATATASTPRQTSTA